MGPFLRCWEISLLGITLKRKLFHGRGKFSPKCLAFPEKLNVSVYLEDDEAYDIWHNEVGLPKAKFSGWARKTTSGSMAPACGPCSEIYFDRGPEKGCGKEGCTVGCDCDRFIEVWNLVFTQFDRQKDMTYLPLKSKNIDTGMGLERLACVMQQVEQHF
jgi:alanyl-tRNA synthetase